MGSPSTGRRQASSLRSTPAREDPRAEKGTDICPVGGQIVGAPAGDRPMRQMLHPPVRIPERAHSDHQPVSIPMLPPEQVTQESDPGGVLFLPGGGGIKTEKLRENGVQRPENPLRIQRGVQDQGVPKSFLPGSEGRLPPPGGSGPADLLLGVGQGAVDHHLLPGQELQLPEKPLGMVPAQSRQRRAYRQLPGIEPALQGQPQEIIELVPPAGALIPGEEGLHPLRPQIFVAEAQQGVEVKIRFSILLEGHEIWVPAIASGGIPDDVQRPALLPGVFPVKHG